MKLLKKKSLRKKGKRNKQTEKVQALFKPLEMKYIGTGKEQKAITEKESEDGEEGLYAETSSRTFWGLTPLKPFRACLDDLKRLLSFADKMNLREITMFRS